MGPLGPHTIPMFESLKIWEWYGNSMGSKPHKGVPTIKVPGITQGYNWLLLTPLNSQICLTCLIKDDFQRMVMLVLSFCVVKN